MKTTANHKRVNIVNSDLKIIFQVYGMSAAGTNFIYENSEFENLKEAKKYYEKINLENKGEEKNLVCKILNSEDEIEKEFDIFYEIN